MNAVGGLLPSGQNKTVLTEAVYQVMNHLENNTQHATQEDLAQQLEEMRAIAEGMGDF